ncbi:MAG: ABC transporter ATP-binding protein [Methylobacteriaceae bacterium]|nr:ABC transporter ATP-binding protein [Methylobacteriaceae bacterium]
MALVEIDELHLTMTSYDGAAHVLAGVSLSLERGEIWGLVGETGCGKSLTGLTLSRLVASPPARYLSGAVRFDGRDLLAADEETMRDLRGRRIGMIFQDPTTNLNPAFRVGTQMIDVALHAGRVDPSILGLAAGASRGARRRAARDLAVSMLDRVGIVDAARRIDDYPHQFSGGMRQRVLIAMALIGRPDLIIADEPTTALDVSVQAQILALLHRLAAEDGLAILLITHNLGVVAQIASHVAVMYAGAVVEAGDVRAVLKSPRHPYTQALIAALPRADVKRGALAGLPGVVPDLLTPPPGCRFLPRCPIGAADCARAAPGLAPVDTGQRVACFRAERAA